MFLEFLKLGMLVPVYLFVSLAAPKGISKRTVFKMARFLNS